MGKPNLVWSTNGLLREEHKKVMAEIEADVFKHWDSFASSPSKTRPRPPAEELKVEGLTMCTFSAATGACWPDHVLEKFPAHSAEHKELAEMKNKFYEEFPRPSSNAASAAPGSAPPRVVGRPDFTDSENPPLDVERMIDVETVSPPPPAERCGLARGPISSWE